MTWFCLSAPPRVHCQTSASHEQRLPVVVYEPTLDVAEFYGSQVVKNLDAFKGMRDCLAGRTSTTALLQEAVLRHVTVRRG
jgi:hypothetical protein